MTPDSGLTLSMTKEERVFFAQLGDIPFTCSTCKHSEVIIADDGTEVHGDCGGNSYKRWECCNRVEDPDKDPGEWEWNGKYN